MAKRRTKTPQTCYACVHRHGITSETFRCQRTPAAGSQYCRAHQKERAAFAPSAPMVSVYYILKQHKPTRLGYKKSMLPFYFATRGDADRWTRLNGPLLMWARPGSRLSSYEVCHRRIPARTAPPLLEYKVRK